ncbi:HPr kinase [Kordiimonas sediminis]|uniref:HPr kinase n=1 Tax=Kordiimonas sediminis TaxID=1735581 RepID=A0A919AP60_9PROT|nr:aldolase [Kordiimonas sediminis]GHF16639.1 HPr kinase [Kordiimonas sediminis]
MGQKPEYLHATAVSVRGAGVLLTGPSGSGKSDLAVRLIDRGALLISDDQCLLVRGDSDEDRLILRAPDRLVGKIEVRGIGILDFPVTRDVPLWLHVVLDPADPPERLPSKRFVRLGGVDVPSVHISPFEASAPIKVELVVKCLANECRAVATFLD